jgi:hypothetical protein
MSDLLHLLCISLIHSLPPSQTKTTLPRERDWEYFLLGSILLFRD